MRHVLETVFAGVLVASKDHNVLLFRGDGEFDIFVFCEWVPDLETLETWSDRLSQLVWRVICRVNVTVPAIEPFHLAYSVDIVAVFGVILQVVLLLVLRCTCSCRVL